MNETQFADRLSMSGSSQDNMNDYLGPELCAIVESILTGFDVVLKGKELSPCESMKLYSEVYKYCSITEKSRRTQILDDEFIVQSSQGQYLFDRMKKLLTDHFEYISTVISQGFYPLADVYLEQWNAAMRSVKQLDSICAYLNRNWVKSARLLTSKKVCSFGQLAITKWTRIVFNTFKVRLIDEFLLMVTEDRKHNAVNMNKLKIFCEHMQKLTHDREARIIEPNENRMSIKFEEEFAPRFLHMTEAYLSNLSREEFHKNVPFIYLKIIKSTLDLEMKRTNDYVHPLLSIEVKGLIDNICIQPYLTAFYDMVKQMLSEDYYEGVKVFYDMLIDQRMVIQELKNILSDSLKRLLVARMEVLGQPLVDPQIFVNELSEIFQKYDYNVSYAFSASPIFDEVKIQAYSHMINNAFNKTSSVTAAKLFSKFINLIITKHPDVSYNLLSNKLFSAVIRGLVLIRDKDIFKNMYTKYLAKRLIERPNCLLQIELKIIEEFHSKFDEEFIADMKKMCNDISDSNEINSKYYSTISTESELRPYFLVLYSKSWPVVNRSNVVPPLEIKEYYKSFSDWYYRVQKNQIIQFVDDLTLVDLKMGFPSSTYFLNVTAFHATILLLFRGSNVRTVEFLRLSSQLNRDMLYLTLYSLVDHSLLKTNHAIHDIKPSDMEDDWMFELNSDFNSSSKFLRIRLPYKILASTISNNAVIYCGLDRNYTIQVIFIYIQATTIKILKPERSLSASDLMSKILESIGHMDGVSDSSINKNIDSLIERDYIRFNSDLNTYNYVC